MKECPQDADPTNCAYEALKLAADNRQIVILPEQEPSLVLEDSVKNILEICSVNGVRVKSAWEREEEPLDSAGSQDIAEFGCLACGECVLVIDDMEKISVRKQRNI